MIRIISASLLAVGLTAGAGQANDLRILQTGENFQVDYGADHGNVVGGGAVTVKGGGESAEYTRGPFIPSESGRYVESVTGGERGEILYRTPVPTRAASTRTAPR